MIKIKYIANSLFTLLITFYQNENEKKYIHFISRLRTLLNARTSRLKMWVSFAEEAQLLFRIRYGKMQESEDLHAVTMFPLCGDNFTLGVALIFFFKKFSD